MSAARRSIRGRRAGDDAAGPGPARELPRVVLEWRTAEHADALFPLLADPAVYRYLDDDPPASIDALRAIFAATESGLSPGGRDRWLNWVVRGTEGAVAGYVQATVAPDGETQVAYALGRAFWGRGYARAAVVALLARVAASFGTTRFVVRVERANHRSVRLAATVGFTAASPATRRRHEPQASELLLELVVREAP